MGAGVPEEGGAAGGSQEAQKTHKAGNHLCTLVLADLALLLRMVKAATLRGGRRGQIMPKLSARIIAPFVLILLIAGCVAGGYYQIQRQRASELVMHALMTNNLANLQSALQQGGDPECHRSVRRPGTGRLMGPGQQVPASHRGRLDDGDHVRR